MKMLTAWCHLHNTIVWWMNNSFSFWTNILWNEYLRFNLELNIKSSINFMFFKVSFEKYPNKICRNVYWFNRVFPWERWYLEMIKYVSLLIKLVLQFQIQFSPSFHAYFPPFQPRSKCSGNSGWGSQVPGSSIKASPNSSPPPLPIFFFIGVKKSHAPLRTPVPRPPYAKWKPFPSSKVYLEFF